MRNALANLRTAGFHRGISVSEKDFCHYTPSTKPTFIIANPPYGKRMGGDEAFLSPLYLALGDFLKAQAPARAFVLTAVDYPVGLKPNRRNIISTGGMEARFLEFDLY